MIGRGEKKRGRKLKESGNEWESRLENVEGNFVGIRGSCRAKKWGVMGERGEEKKRLTHRRGERLGNAEKRIHHRAFREKKWRVASGEWRADEKNKEGKSEDWKRGNSRGDTENTETSERRKSAAGHPTTGSKSRASEQGGGTVLFGDKRGETCDEWRGQKGKKEEVKKWKGLRVQEREKTRLR